MSTAVKPSDILSNVALGAVHGAVRVEGDFWYSVDSMSKINVGLLLDYIQAQRAEIASLNEQLAEQDCRPGDVFLYGTRPHGVKR